MDTLVYAPESANQHESWQLGLPADYPTELPNIAPKHIENIEASLPPQSLLLMYVVYSFYLVIKVYAGEVFNKILPITYEELYLDHFISHSHVFFFFFFTIPICMFHSAGMILAI